MKHTATLAAQGSWLSLTLLLVLLLVSCGPASPAMPAQSVNSTQAAPLNTPVALSTQAAPSEAPTVTPTQTALPTNTAVPLPLTSAEDFTAQPMPLLGMEVYEVNETTLNQLSELGVTVVRHNALLWSKVERLEGERNWEAVTELENSLQMLASRGIQVILIVRSTPDWAQKEWGYPCGPVKRGKIKAFARFLKDAVARYSAPPFSVKFWEIGNEPDVDHSLIPPNSVFGCWGDQEDEYYGGEYYARVLKGIYPAIKKADPQAQVLTGGLLLDCDPTHPPEDRDCQSSRFLEGILRGGGADFFDIVSFHGYPPYITNLEMDEFYPLWASRGGVVLGKISFLREVMAAYEVEKPLMHTESALVCPEWNPTRCTPPGPEFTEAQADYLTILYVRNWEVGVAGTVWYHLEGPGWRHVGLFDEQGAPRPAYHALRFLNQMLGSAQYTGPVTLTPVVRGAAFQTPEKRIWVLWSPDAWPDTVPLPDGVIQVLDKYGNPLPWEDGTLNVLSPVYVELKP